MESILGTKLGSSHEIEARTIAEKALDLASQNGYSLSITGHSLGGWLAQLSLFFIENEFKHEQKYLNYNKPIKAVVFDAPGSVEHMMLLKSNLL